MGRMKRLLVRTRCQANRGQIIYIMGFVEIIILYRKIKPKMNLFPAPIYLAAIYSRKRPPPLNESTVISVIIVNMPKINYTKNPF